MLKHNKKYNPTVDMANRKKSTRKKETLIFKPNKNRRYQDYAQKAPLSKRQTKKRNKYKQEEVAWQKAIDGTQNQNLRQ